MCVFIKFVPRLLWFGWIHTGTQQVGFWFSGPLRTFVASLDTSSTVPVDPWCDVKGASDGEFRVVGDLNHLFVRPLPCLGNFID